jgi:ABC-type Fe3+-hydroxamate transport system substrate-binding protein
MKKFIPFSIIALFLIAFVSCKKSENSHTVRYSLQGTSKSTVTYTDQNGTTQTVTNADASYTVSFASTNHGMLLKLTAISTDGTSNIGGKIFIDDVQTAQSNGNASSISISATLP